jgi:hypothetical protein
MKNSDLYRRLFSKVDKKNSHWVWRGTTMENGYGTILFLAHRLTYELLRGPIPEGLVVDHVCRKRNCVNPAHMRIVTLQENNRVGNSPAAKNARKKKCKYGHRFTPENTIPHKRYKANGTVYWGRVCKKCLRIEQKNYRERRRVQVSC